MTAKTRFPACFTTSEQKENKSPVVAVYEETHWNQYFKFYLRHKELFLGQVEII